MANTAPKINVVVDLPADLDMPTVGRASAKVSLASLGMLRGSCRRSADLDPVASTRAVDVVVRSYAATGGPTSTGELVCFVDAAILGTGSHPAASPASEAPKGGRTFSIVARYKLTYRCIAGQVLTADEQRHFAAANPAFNAWSFLREFADHAAGRLGLPRFVLPLFRLPSQRALAKRVEATEAEKK